MYAYIFKSIPYDLYLNYQNIQERKQKNKPAGRRKYYKGRRRWASGGCVSVLFRLSKQNVISVLLILFLSKKEAPPFFC